MKIARWGRFAGLLAAALTVGAILAVGCGGGDGDKIDFSGGKDSANSSATKDSGDSSNSDNGDGATAESGDQDSGGSSKDADKYASQVCGAISKYTNEIEELSNSAADFEDPEAMKDMMDQAVPVLKGISKDLDKINPPSDVEEWHNQMVSGMSAAAELFSKMGDALDKPLDEAMADIEELTTEMTDMENPFGSMVDLPDDYQAAFESNPDCEELQNLEFFE